VPTFFDRFAAVADSVTDRTFGGNVLIEPLGSEGYTGDRAGDPGRPVMTIIGVFTAKPVEDTLSGQEGGEARIRGLARIEVRKTVLKISCGVVATIPYELKEGDRITRLDADSDNVFAVTDAVLSDLGDLTVHLVNA
jgi:hypothetical protein